MMFLVVGFRKVVSKYEELPLQIAQHFVCQCIKVNLNNVL